jgi:hypothetical protein
MVKGGGRVPAKKPKVVQVAAVGSSGGSGARLVALDEYGEIWVTRVQGLPTPNWERVQPPGDE